MRRRQVLAALGAGAVPFTGCTGVGPASGTPDDTTTTDERALPTVSVHTAYDQPPDASVTVEVVRQFSRDHPAKIRVAYTNTVEREREVTFQASPPFSDYLSADGHGPRLVVVPDDHSHIAPGEVIDESSDATSTEDTDDTHQLIPKEPVDGCWRVPTTFAVFGVAHPTTLSPGETVAEEYTILGHYSNETCLPATDYRFEQARYAGSDQPWGFRLCLER